MLKSQRLLEPILSWPRRRKRKSGEREQFGGLATFQLSTLTKLLATLRALLVAEAPEKEG